MRFSCFQIFGENCSLRKRKTVVALLKKNTIKTGFFFPVNFKKSYKLIKLRCKFLHMGLKTYYFSLFTVWKLKDVYCLNVVWWKCLKYLMLDRRFSIKCFQMNVFGWSWFCRSRPSGMAHVLILKSWVCKGVFWSKGRPSEFYFEFDLL